MEMTELSSRAQELLAGVQAYCQKSLDAGKWPGIRDMAAEFHADNRIFAEIRKYLLVNGLLNVPDKFTGGARYRTEGILAQTNATPEATVAVLKEINEMTEDGWTISLPRTRIHTLEQLIEVFQIDLEKWEVERWVANKWEMGYKNEVGEPGTEPLYQVKAFLRRKRFTDIEHAYLENAKLRQQVEKTKLQLNNERKMTKRLAINHAGYDELIPQIKDFVNSMGDLSLKYKRVHPLQPQLHAPVSPDHTEDVVALWSDTHFGDVIRREDTSGFPEYDLVISANRWAYTIQKTKMILAIHRAAYPLKKLYIWVGGDIGNGVLHDAPNSNSLFMPAQVHFGYHMLKFGIEELVQLTEPDENGVRIIEEIVLLFTVGNHMRVDEKMPHKYQAQRTLDWLIYQFLIERFGGYPHVTIRQEMSPYIFETIRGHRHLFAHGMQVGFRNSPDAQNKSITNFINLARGLFDSPEWRKTNGLEGETFSRACIGDIHIPVRYPRFISNGSLNGQNELGANWMLEPIPAAQWLWGVSESHQETFHYLVESTKVQRQPKYHTSYGVFAEDYMERIGRGGTK